ncbi:MAG TPA: hypothetical protein VNV43_08755, partial [Candidatus Acidoferrales bacterium]|nr:hypothetical protein [Candidatus Acidoferrales bacterium]
KIGESEKLICINAYKQGIYIANLDANSSCVPRKIALLLIGVGLLVFAFTEVRGIHKTGATVCRLYDFSELKRV